VIRSVRTLLLAALLLLAVPVAAGAQGGTAKVSVVHGIPGTPVDVYVNGKRLLDDFQPKTVAGPLSLPAGRYRLAVRAANAPASARPILQAEATLQAGQDVSVVAHLSEGGQPRLTIFPNDVSAIPAGQARVSVRHTAAAPAVDVQAGGQKVVRGLSNPDARTLTVPAGTVRVAVTPAGQSRAVLGPASLTLAAGGNYAVYAIGSLRQGTLDLLVQRVGASAGAPGGVPAGDSGLAAAGGGAPVGLLLPIAAAALLAMGASALTLRRRRAAR
jgi:hypothetical protein